MLAMSKLWESWARLDFGDHGLGAQRDDPARVGLIELTDSLRWVPREGEGWAVPIAALTVHTPKSPINRPSKGVEITHPELGRLRIRALSHAPGVPLAAVQAYSGQAHKAGALLKQLLKRGAMHAPVA